MTRRYRDATLILETTFETQGGRPASIDCMTRRDGVTGPGAPWSGACAARCPMRTELVVRFDYGNVVPWVSRQEDGRLQLTAGPDRLLLDTAVQLRGEDFTHRRRVRVSARGRKLVSR